MSIPVAIRIATPADAVLLADLGSRTFREAFASANTPGDMDMYIAASFSPGRQAAELAEPGNTFLLAEREHTPVGYAHLRGGPSPECVAGAHPVELVRIYAVRQWIGHGIGTALMDTCIETGRDRGHDVLWLGVWEQNPRAIQFYHSWGFVTVGSHPFLLGTARQTDFVMQRGLQEHQHRRP